MEVNKVIVEGIDVILKRDIDKHQALLKQSKTELLAYRESLAYQAERRRWYYKQMKSGKYNKESMEREIAQIKQNCAQIEAKIKLSDDAIEHHTLIVNTLSAQLNEHNFNMRELMERRKKNGSAN